MFNFFKKDPLKHLERDYARLLEQARDLQRNGDIKGFADKTSEADAILQRIQELESRPGSTDQNRR